MTDIQNGDKVLLNRCPKYGGACGAHRAKVIGDPVETTDGSMIAPVRFNCIGIAHSNYPCNQMVKVRSNRVKLSKPALVTGIVLGIVLILGLWFAANYNDLVHSRNEVANSHARIDTAVERRYELVDNLVASVKGAQGQEQEVFGAIANARKQASSSGSTSGQAAGNAQLDTQIALLPRLQEQYPDLKSNDQVSKLIGDLETISVEVRDARNAYNDTATNYDNNISSFPKNIFASLYNFKTAPLYKADAAAQANPKVDFGKYGNGTENNSQTNQSSTTTPATNQ